MMSLSNKIVIFLNILSVIKVSLLETVHFTNSPNKLLTAKNFTTYKVEVPGSDPITIIEANTPVINNPTNFNQNLNSKYSINRIRNKLNNNNDNNDENVMDLKTSLSMTVTPDNYYHTNINNNDVKESVTNQQNYNNDVPQYSTMKTVYSPELLKKFLKDYADKLSTNSNNLSQDKLEEIIKLKNKIQSQIDGNQDKVPVDETDDSDSDEEKDDNDNDDDENRRHSSGVETDDDDTNNHLSERKSYHPNKYYSGSSGSGSGSNNYYGSNKHPYNKNEGWVSLDAVPWSTSKVSKWHSSANNKYPGQNPFDRPPRPFSSSGVNRPGRPGSSYYVDDNEDEYNNNEDDYYGNHGQYENRPFNRPPTSFSSQSHHNSNFNYPYDYYDNKNPPTDNFYHHSSQHIQTSHDHRPGHNSHGHASHSLAGSSSYSGYAPDKPPRPWQPEIITDDSTPDFPSSYHQGHHQGSSQSHNRPNDYHYNNMKQKLQVGGHRVPSTYPNSGVDGQWVLVSTTKGYQFPKRNGQRAMSFKTQNGMTSANGVRYNNKLVEDFHSNYNGNGNINKGIITAESVNYDTTIKANNNRPTMTTQQKGIKLSVLPLFLNDKDSNEETPEGTVSLFRPPPTPPQEYEHHDDPYQGMIEVGPSTETIEESVAAAAQANEQNALTSTTKKKKKKKNKNNYNIMRKQSDSTSSVLAAVGAGLVPATMAMLAPMVLGRKRRSLVPDLPYQYDNQ